MFTFSAFFLKWWIKALAYIGSEILQDDLVTEVVKIFIVHSDYAMNVQMKDWGSLLSNNARAHSSAQTVLSTVPPQK